MNRAEATSFIGSRFAKYLSAASRTAADTTGNLKEVLDDAFRALGFATADIPTAATDGAEADQDLMVQLPYRALEHICRDLGATFFDVTDDGSYKLSQVRGACQKDLERAEAEVLNRFGTLGVVDGDGASDGLSTIDLNYLTDDWRVLV